MPRPREYEDDRRTTSITVDVGLLNGIRDKGLNLSEICNNAMATALNKAAPIKLKRKSPEDLVIESIDAVLNKLPPTEKIILIDNMRNGLDGKRPLGYLIKFFRREHGVRCQAYHFRLFVEKYDEQKQKEKKHVEALLNGGKE